MRKIVKTLIPVFIPLSIAILYLIPGSLNKNILKEEISFYQWIQPSDSLTSDIVIITIGDEDVRVLGGWPISRDYYSYAIHALHQSGAKAIGLDVFFSGSDKRYPRYDSTLANFIASTGNVVLPMFFSELQDTMSANIHTFGRNANYSIPVISESAAANGFSNLGPDAVIYEVPLIVNSDQGIRYSFAAELVRLYRDLIYTFDNKKILRNRDSESLNQFVGEEYIYLNYPDANNFKQHYSFVNLIQTFRGDPSSIDLNDKLAIIINTVTGVAQIKSTPLNDLVPASLIHIVTIHNLLMKNWLKIVPQLVGWMLIFLLGLISIVNWSYRSLSTTNIGLILVIPISYFSLAILSYLFFQILFPLIYPLVSFGLGIIVAKVTEIKARQIENRLRNYQLDQQLLQKKSELEAVRKQLKDLHVALDRETDSSDKILKQVEVQKQSIADLEKELTDLQAYRSPVTAPTIAEVEGIIYSKASIMQQLMDMVAKVSSNDIPVLISGETGTGKELIALTIHQRSKRGQAPFIAINCGALPETLLESELFGHEKGSFTGATALRKGRFELADGGTVFLDEVTETSPAFQARLLRVLQEGTFERVGGQRQHRSDIRIIAATNKDIQELINKGKFRSDLFYRLNGFPITMPPLRERKDDIPLLAEHFIKKHGYDEITGFSTQAMQYMINYPWPGNVRELENCVRRAGILAQSEQRSIIQGDDLPQDIKEQSVADRLQMVHKPLDEQILELLREFKFSHSSIAQTANLLGKRDRGTITEYFKGICFQYIIEANLKISEAISNIAGSHDEQTCENVRQKIIDYMTNLKMYADLPAQADKPANLQAPPYKGLPKKFDAYLDQILANLPEIIQQL